MTRLSNVFISGMFLLPARLVVGQAVPDHSDSAWLGQRIVMLKGFGEVHYPLDSSRLVSSVGINLVTSVARQDGHRLWVVSTSGGDSGWVDTADVSRLSDAIPLFTALIERDSSNWDAYLRRAEVEHALNQRAVATGDYTRAIVLHPEEAFLYLRRGRHYTTLHVCNNALRDFVTAIRLIPRSAPQAYNLTAELYSLESGVYAGCPDSSYRSPAGRCQRFSVRSRSIRHAPDFSSFWLAPMQAVATSSRRSPPCDGL